MRNLYEVVKEHMFFKKFVLGDIVCIEYTCPLEEEHLGIFSQTDYIIHVLSGKKSWRTIEGTWEVTAGETFFAKKGATIVTQDFDDEFCMLGFFLPDDLIRNSLSEIIHQNPNPLTNVDARHFTATKLQHKTYLESFYQSLYPYFRNNDDPPEAILRSKLKELLINIYNYCDQVDLIQYLRSVLVNKEPSLTTIMETNFAYNLKLEEYAKLCHRSLSKFKRDFFNHYNTTPGKWLLERRVSHATQLLLNGNQNNTHVAFESGFEDVSHFSRVFKKKHGLSPRNYLKSVST